MQHTVAYQVTLTTIFVVAQSAEDPSDWDIHTLIEEFASNSMGVEVKSVKLVPEKED